MSNEFRCLTPAYRIILSVLSLLALILAEGALNSVTAQNSGNLAIDQAQRAVRQRIITQEGGRDLTVVFNTDAETDFRSQTQVRVRGTGSFSRNADSRYSKAPTFSYGITPTRLINSGNCADRPSLKFIRRQN